MMISYLKPAILIAILTGVATPALAVCAGNQIDVFSCSFGTKQVELCMTTDEQSVTYRFGPIDAPELELTRGFDDITMQPWNGIGRSIWEQVSIAKGQFSYVLYTSFDKFDQTHVGGLDVMRGDQTLAALSCVGEGAQNNFSELVTLSFAMSDAGYCRQDMSNALRAGPCD